MTRPLFLLWTDGADAYRKAISAAGLDQRIRLEELPRDATPSAAQLQEAEAMLTWGPPAGTLAQMPKLRWAQALTAGVEHWLARADLPPGLMLTCARGTHRVQMPENILGALFHITKPYAAIVGDNAAATWTRRVSSTLAGQTLGILGAALAAPCPMWIASICPKKPMRCWRNLISSCCCCPRHPKPRISSMPRGSCA